MGVTGAKREECLEREGGKKKLEVLIRAISVE